MDTILNATLTTLSNEVEATAIPSDCKHTAAWCLGKLPLLYTQYRNTNESRFGDEITRLVQAVMQELTKGQVICAEADALAAGLAGRFQTLHEGMSLPPLRLRDTTRPKTAAATKKAAKAKR